MFDLLKINGPDDVKKLSAAELPELCEAMRAALIKRAAKHTGHVGPNLGFLECTVALHRVFNPPTDKIVFDVSHQTDPHKMLTGRMRAYVDEAHYSDVSGYSEPSESPHDHFIIGHTSTSVSLACGLAKARDLQGQKYNVIAVIGDGALTGGEAFEGLNNVSVQGGNFIVILNDNDMSIAPNHGGFIGHFEQYIKSLGLDYRFVPNGNDVHAVIAALEEVKDIDHPVVVHVKTEKGHGWRPATEHKEAWHWGVAPFDPVTGKPLEQVAGGWIGSRFADFMLKKMAADPKVILINAAVPGMCNFGPVERAKAGRQFVDVGICEPHAVAFTSALAAGGAKPVFSVVSTFVQRTYDQLSQDLAVNDSPATIVVTAASLTMMNDVTHLGFFDIPLISNIPNVVYGCPTCEKEYFAMLEWSIEHRQHPVVIRQPHNGELENEVAVLKDYSGSLSYDVTRKGTKVAILGLGNFYTLGRELADALKADGIDATLINPRVATALDTETLEALKADHQVVITLEDGVIDGGFGEKIARYYGPTAMRVLVRGLAKHFEDRYDANDLLQRNRLAVDQLKADVLQAIK